MASPTVATPGLVRAVRFILPKRPVWWLLRGRKLGKSGPLSVCHECDLGTHYEKCPGCGDRLRDAE
jgi:hypothetical protein